MSTWKPSFDSPPPGQETFYESPDKLWTPTVDPNNPSGNPYVNPLDPSYAPPDKLWTPSVDPNQPNSGSYIPPTNQTGSGSGTGTNNPNAYVGSVPPGTYWIRNVSSNAALDLTESNPAAGTPMINYVFNKTNNQKWILESGAKGYKIKSVATGTYLSFANGVPCAQNSSTSGNPTAVEWQVVKIGNNYQLLISTETNLALTLKDNVKQDRTPITVSLNAQGLHQQWIIEDVSVRYSGPLSAGSYWIRNLYSKGALDLSEGKAAAGTPIVNWEPNKAEHQKWILEPGTAGYKIKNSHTGTYLSFADKVAAVQNSSVSGNSTAVEWELVALGSNYQFLLASNKGLVLDLADWKTNNGNRIIAWSNHKGANQQWTLESA